MPQGLRYTLDLLFPSDLLLLLLLLDPFPPRCPLPTIDELAMRSYQVFWLSAMLRCVSADWQYLSRPDLSPPKLNITVPASSRVESGYIFVTPTAGFIEGSVGPEQPGAYIFRDDGELVWSGLGYVAGFAGDFSPTVIDGKIVLRSSQGQLDSFHGRMYGDHVVLNDRYQTVSIVRAASHRLVSAHEFNVVDGKTVLVEAPVPVPADLSIYGGDEGQEWILNHGFQGESESTQR